VSEVVSVSSTSVELFDGTVYREDGLVPGTEYERRGLTFTTAPTIGDRMARICTTNDVHFGETECGKFGGGPAQFWSLPGERPYPTLMNESVVGDMAEMAPDLVVVRGDLTNAGEPTEYEEFLEMYHGAFSERLIHVRGNHDGYAGRAFADTPVQVVDVPGVRIVLLDTGRAFQSYGCISDDQIDATLPAARDATTPTIVMGHHPLDVPGADLPADGVCVDDAERFARAVLDVRSIVAYTAGHTHRCKRYDYEGLPLIETASVKDFPGVFGRYDVGTNGISYTVHRASSPEAVIWAERTRAMFDGFYGTYAYGHLDDRSVTLPLER
jgi:3',5'-cyclic AMP phosphodiesterase CpdA